MTFQYRETPDKIVLDFSRVQFLSSAMIGELVLRNETAKQQSLDIRLANVSRNVLEVLKITRLNKVFRIDDDVPFGHAGCTCTKSETTEHTQWAGGSAFKLSCPPLGHNLTPVGCEGRGAR